ncbi:nucleotidyltransferase family protein [Chromatiaceae bacterium AAb-1]|nr:nucleotidyltransferase family protein [Chromatiaceae bacterium AAb-1]
MMKQKPLLQFFQEPAVFTGIASAADWTLLLQQAREQGLLARLYYVARRHQLLPKLPEKVLQHSLSGAKYAAKQQHSLFFELQLLEPLFQRAGHPCVLLKGAAYRAAALPVSYGRLFADIDLLVPAEVFRQTRDALLLQGFHEGQISDYDRQYYLNWSHQNPPLQHYQRGTVLDLHHHIFPVAATKQINIAPVFEQAVPLAGSAFSIPCTEHLFIHAAVHLFYQEETHKLLKEIIDLNALLDDVVQKQALAALLEQADRMQTVSAVLNALYVLAEIFRHQSLQIFLQEQQQKQDKFTCLLMLSMLRGRAATAWLARQCWFVRGHFLKMRWSVLLYHSLAKPGSRLRNWLKTVTSG